jgi:hypothetical protein
MIIGAGPCGGQRGGQGVSAEASLSLLVSCASHTVSIPHGAVLGCFGPKNKESKVAFPLFCQKNAKKEPRGEENSMAGAENKEATNGHPILRGPERGSRSVR